MKSLYILIFICFAFVLCRLSWVVYEFSFTKKDVLPKFCECSCIDTKIFSLDLQTSVHYSGPRSTSTCSCEEFFLPKMKKRVDFVDVKALCDICECDYAKKSDLEVTMTYVDIFDTVTVTVFCVTFVLILHRWIQFVNHEVFGLSTEERNERRVSRAFRVLEDFCAENVNAAKSKTKELLENSRALRVNIHDCPDGTQNQRNYQTF